MWPESQVEGVAAAGSHVELLGDMGQAFQLFLHKLDVTGMCIMSHRCHDS